MPHIPVILEPQCGDRIHSASPFQASFPRFLSSSPRLFSSSSRRRGSPILLSGIFFYKSFPRCEPSLARHNDCSAQPCSRIYEIASPSPTQLVDTSCFRLTDSLCSTVRSGSPHLGQKTKKWLWLTSFSQLGTFFAGKNRYYRRKLL